MIGKINATEIDTWAKLNPRKAQEILPELIIRLILATSKKVDDFNFPIEKGIQFAGYDGVLWSGENTSFFPEGKSVWEFGTDNDAITKFKGDIKKRSANSLGVNIKDTAFIFATLKIWNHRTSIEELVNESKVSYDWADIRIVDASKIALWLESCPAVSIWMCEIMGKPTSRLLSVDQYWKENCHSTSPILVKEFFLHIREDQLNALSTWLCDESGNDYRILMAESSHEAALFIAAAVMSLSESESNDLKRVQNKVIFVTSLEAWNEIISYEGVNGSIFVPVFNFTEEIRCPANISAILPISKFSPSAKITKNIAKIELPTRTRSNFSQALEMLGYTTGDAYDIVTKTKRSFLSFYRLITKLPSKSSRSGLYKIIFKNLFQRYYLGAGTTNIQ